MKKLDMLLEYGKIVVNNEEATKIEKALYSKRIYFSSEEISENKVLIELDILEEEI